MKKLVIVGGGFAGISLAKTLANTQFEITLIDKSNHHLFQPLLYQVATAALSPGDIAVPIREIMAHAKNVRVIMDEVISINHQEHTIDTSSKLTYSYDLLVLAVGARHSYFGHNEWEQFAPGPKTLGDALKIRNRTLASFEKAEKLPDEKIEPYMNFVVVGGGPTGVEVAGAFAEIAKQTLINDFRRIDSSQAKIYLIEGAPRILMSYPESLSNKAQKYLEELGVEVLTNQLVNNITADYVEVGSRKIFTKNAVWAAGNIANGLLKQLNVPLDRMGRVFVSKDLSIKDHPEIFILGDAACFIDKNGRPLPGLAPVAAQQGKFLGKMLLSQKKDEFSYFDKGQMATIGKFKAVALFKKIYLDGMLAWLAWCFVHILFLIDFRNKVIVFIQWVLAFLFKKRGVRIINDNDLSNK